MHVLRALFTLALLFLPTLKAEAALGNTVLSVRTLPISISGVPRGATRVRILPVILTASCHADVSVHAITIRNAGLGNRRDITRVYLLQKQQRIGRAKRFGASDQRVTFRLPHFTVPACSSTQLDVAIDISRAATVGARYALSIDNPWDIEAGAERLIGEFPVQTRGARASVTPDPAGELVIEFRPLAGKIHAVKNEALSRFYLEAKGKHHLLYAITLTNRGTAKDDDLRNLYITRNNGRALTQVEKFMDKDQVTLRFSRPYFLRKGNRALFQLRGNAYTRKKSIDFHLEEPVDILATSSRRGGGRLGR